MRGLVQRVAQHDVAGPRVQPFQEIVQRDALHENPRAVRTDLPRGIEIPQHRATNRRIEIGIVKHDQR